jgi:hypothetical protein
MNFEKLNQEHDIAMELAGDAFAARRLGNLDEMARLFRAAFALERAVALEVAKTDLEPRRSVLLRSAATLAVDCGEIREAEKLISIALAGEPPKAIARELRELLMQVVPQLV